MHPSLVQPANERYEYVYICIKRRETKRGRGERTSALVLLITSPILIYKSLFLFTNIYTPLTLQENIFPLTFVYVCLYVTYATFPSQEFATNVHTSFSRLVVCLFFSFYINAYQRKKCRVIDGKENVTNISSSLFFLFCT